MKKATLLLAFLFCFAGTANAQFFKKLAKKAEKAAEKTVERRVEKKASEETDRMLDSTIDRKRKQKNKPSVNNKTTRESSIPSLSKATPSESYSFNHKATMQIVNGKEKMDADYFLPKSDAYFGMGIKDERMQGDFMMVYDTKREAMFTFMENSGQKMKMSMSFKSDEASVDALDFDIKATGKTKKIIGYLCKEYKMTSEDMTATIWVTKDVDFRFPTTLPSAKKNKRNTQEWMKDLDGWVMEMDMIITTEKKPQTIKMICTSIDKSNLVINSSDYQSLGY